MLLAMRLKHAYEVLAELEASGTNSYLAVNVRDEIAKLEAALEDMSIQDLIDNEQIIYV